MTTLYKKEDLRSEERVSVDLPVEITWYDSEGIMFSERTRIEDVTSVGCRFGIGVELHPGDFISINRLVPVNQEMVTADQVLLFEIMWSARGGIRWSTGARKLEGEKLAKVKILLANYSAKRSSK